MKLTNVQWHNVGISTQIGHEIWKVLVKIQLDP